MYGTRSFSDGVRRLGTGMVNTEESKNKSIYRKQLDRNRIESYEKKLEILKSSGEWNMSRRKFDSQELTEDRSLQEPVRRK